MSATPRSGPGRTTLVAAALVVVLAVGALVLPDRQRDADAMPLLVYDPTGLESRRETVHAPLAAYLAAVTGRPVPLQVFTRAQPLLEAAAARDAFVFAPDGLALRLDRVRFAPLAAVRRPAPRNLRPRGVLVHRRDDAAPAAPWRLARARTVLGDTMCLAAVGGWQLAADRAAPAAWPAAGPDPFDHGAALHALRLGCFDYALVRQWDAERFLAAGLLDPRIWTATAVTPPVPDLVVLGPRAWTTTRRLAVGEALARIGRATDQADPAARALERGLATLELAGFNPLLEPDLERLRRELRPGWPSATP